MNDDDVPSALILEHPEELVYTEPPLSLDEIVEIRWMLFGKCPICHAYVKDWAPGPFNARHYNELHDKGIDPLTGHIKTCDEKWRRMP